MALRAHRVRARMIRALLGIALFSAVPRLALPFAHDWHFTELYSNTDGSVQFIELMTTSPGESLTRQATLQESTLGHSFTPATDLTGNTANRSLLLATAGFALLPGAVAPDFILPSNFFSVNGDTLQWTTFTCDIYGCGTIIWDSIAFLPGQLPTSGGLSLNRALGGVTLTQAAMPTNFAGQTGSVVPEPGSAALVALGLALATGWRQFAGRR